MMYPLVETYLYQVGRQLPQKQKKDIIDELRANIYDQLETLNKPANDETVEDLLLQIGSPGSVAMGYTQSVQCVIGPELADSYWTVVKFALIGLTIAFAVIGIISAATINITASNITGIILRFLSNTWKTGLSVYGLITLIFTAVYHGIKSEKLDANVVAGDAEEAWNIKKLKALKTPPHEKNQLKKGDSITGLISIIVGVLLLNALAFGADGSLWFGWLNKAGADSISFKGFNSSLLRAWMPIINILFLSSFVLHVYLLIQDKWNNTARGVRIMLELLSLGVFLALWLNPALIDLTKISLALDAQSIRSLDTAMKIARLAVTAVVLMTSGITIFEQVRKIVKKRE